MIRTLFGIVAVCTVFCLMGCSTKSSPNKDSPPAKPEAVELTKAYSAIRGALGELVALGENGCKEPFTKCPLPSAQKGRVLMEIQENGLTFEQAGISSGQIQRLERKAELKIANQKLAALRARGGARTPQEIQWLSEICWVVFNDDWRLPLDGNPTRSDLRALAPKDSGYISGCRQ